MEPFTIGIAALIIGLFGGGGVGYAFGSAQREARFKELQEQIAKQARVLADLEKRLGYLCHQVQAIQDDRGIFRRFMWFVFKSDPTLFQAFLDLEHMERQRAGIQGELTRVFTNMLEEFPDHPGVKTLRSLNAA